MYRLFYFIILLTIAFTSGASEYMTPEVEKAVAAAKKAPKNQKLNRAAADALTESGMYAEAIPFMLKSGVSGYLEAAETAFDLYDFDNAAEYLDTYVSKRTKEMRAKDEEYVPDWSVEPTDYTTILRHRINLGRSMLDRVENIEVIDSVNVAADDFLRYYRQSRAAGSLRTDARVARILPRGWLESRDLTLSPAAWESEGADYLMFAASSDEGISKIFETYRLADGQWTEPAEVFGFEDIFGKDTGATVDFPFMMPDGITIYFAADGEDSLGGLDIFMSRRGNDSYLQPSNIGMPYNSPANDYMLAFDEVNGIGWWATDRTGIPDSVTIYTFIPRQDMRVNYPIDTPQLPSLAQLKDINLTQNPEADYTTILKRAAENAPAGDDDRADNFALSLPDGRVITSMKEFTKPSARAAMAEYLKAEKLFEANRRQLETMRAQYGKGDHSLSFRILALEDEVAQQRLKLKQLRNNVVTAETSSR